MKPSARESRIMANASSRNIKDSNKQPPQYGIISAHIAAAVLCGHKSIMARMRKDAAYVLAAAFHSYSYFIKVSP